MAAKVTAPHAKAYDKIGDEVVVAVGTGIPDGTADMTAFRALTGMTNAGAVLFEVDGIDYAFPLLTNT